QRTTENAFLLAVEHILAGVDLERHPGAVRDGPGYAGGLLGHGLFSLPRVYRPAGIDRNSDYNVMICPPLTADRNVATPAISTDGSNAAGSIASERKPASHAISRTPSSIDASRNSSNPATPA